ncbi:MAG: hypothetical protein H9W81_17370 [Enterococcus sp.]|nr:hypothetical protein [Enterococcus sp.]
MAGLVRGILAFVRIVAVILFLYVNWPTLSALFSREISWNDAVGTLFSNWSILIISVILILTLVISFLKIRIIAWVLNIVVIAIIIGLFTDKMSMDDVTGTINSYVTNNQVQEAINPCKWTTVVEENGDNIRSVLKDENGTTIGYVENNDTARGTLVDLTGKTITCTK